MPPSVPLWVKIKKPVCHYHIPAHCPVIIIFHSVPFVLFYPLLFPLFLLLFLPLFRQAGREETDALGDKGQKQHSIVVLTRND